MEKDKRKKSKMPCLFGGNGENPKRKTVQPRSSADGITEQNLFSFEVGQSSSKQGYGYGTPMKALLAKEMSNETSAKKRSPSIIAKLMGLDGLPSPQPIHRQQRKFSENSHKNTSKRSDSPFSYQSDKNTMEQQQFKDVYEDPEASHVANQRYSSPSSAKRRSTKKEFGYIQERCDEMIRESNAIKSKLERVDSNSDLMLSFLHLHSQKGTPSDSLCNQITVLKPSNSIRHLPHGKGFEEEIETFNYHVSVSHQRNEDRVLGYSSRRSSRVQLDRLEVTSISPTKIIVLKPNAAKIYNPDERKRYTDSQRFNNGIDEGGSMSYKGSLAEIKTSRHRHREAREIARHITSRMKDDFEGGVVDFFDSGLYNVPKRASASESESSVIREAKKRMSRRWKTYGYKDAGMIDKGSTLEEMLRSSSRSRSVPPSFRNRNHRTCDCDHHEARNEPLNRLKSNGLKGNSNDKDLPSKTSRYNRRSRKPAETYFESEDLDEQEPPISNILDDSTINVTKISSESSNELSQDLANCRLDEDSSNSQEPSTANSGGTASIQLSGPEPESSEGSKEIDQCGEMVPPVEDASSGSDCFEGVNSRLHELRKQLHLLKMESGSSYEYPNDEDLEHQSSFTSLPLSDPDNWESTYLIDILHTSGFYTTDPHTFITTRFTLNSPLNPSLFDHLEKKHSDYHTPVSRSDRHLFYDRVNEALFAIAKTTVLWRRGIQMMENGFEDQLRRLLAKQETEAGEEFEEMSVDKDSEWIEAVREIEIVGKQITELLVSDLVVEIVTV